MSTNTNNAKNKCLPKSEMGIRTEFKTAMMVSAVQFILGFLFNPLVVVVHVLSQCCSSVLFLSMMVDSQNGIAMRVESHVLF